MDERMDGHMERTSKARRWRRAWIGAAAMGVAIVPAGMASAAPASAQAPSASSASFAVHTVSGPATTATCPTPPKAPPVNDAYKVSGYRWNPEHTINYAVDTDRLKSSQIQARVADIRRAMRAAAAYSGLTVHYVGTETTSVNVATHPQLVQFIYRQQKNAVFENLYTYSEDEAEMEGATVDLLPSVGIGYGGFDSKHPVASPEGHFLLFGVGIVSGLDGTKTTYRQVMNPTYSAKYFYTTYQGGDKRGLWKVGSAAGCGGFKY
jgi:hypothetical protein